MIRLFLTLLCLTSCLISWGQASLQAHWYVSQTEVYAGEPFMIELQLPLPESGGINLSPAIQPIIREYLASLGFQEELTQDSTLSPFRLTDTNPPAYILFHRIIYQLQPGTYVLGDPLGAAQGLPTTPVRITVKDFPSTQLNGAQIAADLNISYQLDQATYLTGEVIRLTVKIQGRGNIAMIPQPALGVPEAFLQKEPTTSFRTTWTSRGLTGEKNYLYELIGARQGNFTLGPVRAYYFNLESRRYDSIVLKEIPIQMKGRDIPQLLSRQNLDDFYRNAFAEPSTQKPQTIPHLRLWILGAIGMAILSLIAWGIRVFYDRYRVYKRLRARRRGPKL